ncbi:FMN-binding negative transcriptional regulator [Stutzerimonas zhaodongensis]|uniref:FMN-binding negative transcriptional regulator n=1 Tax=Stutzerimonas zhaodongensis TaxID=1176257 RepID=UPI002107E4A7|nr:FMN-binding negative transcriptional regulator [Stutzerimonas zhaodongensis]MCQ2031579.1 FMN-binding negative transcriptional regulator [Stutzerimonas zhaodongensis]
MYSPAAFRIDDLTDMHEQIEATPLAILVSHGPQGLSASHLPFLLDRGAGKYGVLRGHFARSNPQWQDLAGGAEVMAIFPGASAYVSPGYYPSKVRDHKAVPTWNYVTVHAWGHAEVFDEPTRLRELVRELSDHHERDQPQPWSLADAPADYLDAMLRAIVGFELPIERIAGKQKLSQNQSVENRAGVRDALAASPMPSANEIARLMARSH